MKDGIDLHGSLRRTDGCDLLPSRAEHAWRLYVRALQAVADDLAKRDGHPEGPRMRIPGPMRWHLAVPVDVPADARRPRRREVWSRNAAPPVFHDPREPDFTIEFTPTSSVIVDCGVVADVVTRGSMSMLEAASLWGDAAWPEVEIVTFRSLASKGTKAEAWGFLSEFRKFYDPPETSIG